MNYGVVTDTSTEAKVSTHDRHARKIDNRPNVPGRWVYVETGDAELDTADSPAWLNGFTFAEGGPVAFRHGLDGQTDMIGVYDLVTGTPASGAIAFVMPLRWAENTPEASFFPIEIVTDVSWSAAVQVVDRVTGEVRIFWPIVANPI